MKHIIYLCVLSLLVHLQPLTVLMLNEVRWYSFLAQSVNDHSWALVLSLTWLICAYALYSCEGWSHFFITLFVLFRLSMLLAFGMLHSWSCVTYTQVTCWIYRKIKHINRVHSYGLGPFPLWFCFHKVVFSFLGFSWNLIYALIVLEDILNYLST